MVEEFQHQSTALKTRDQKYRGDNFGVLDQHADIILSESDMMDMHTVKERMSGSSVKRTWEQLHKIIEEFP